ncbi:MAG: polyphenol oxidase family protein, partial [Lachnospiraceae bacterium]|nr:polyphenol oxidase family protein [Lachnospiraceae bacterium]
MYRIKRADRQETIRREEYIYKNGDVEESIEYLTFPILTDTGIVKHLFTTRIGGVSDGIFSSMNLNLNRGDNPERVRENYVRIGKVLDITPEDMVLSMQTHTTNIRRVYKEDAGKGIIKPPDYENVDGLVTNAEGIALVTSYADCVPLYFVDREKHATGLAHSGWRGTAAKMGIRMAEKMKEEFGSSPEDIVAAIGPSICRDCYEVSKEVADEFTELFAGYEAFLDEISASGYRSGYDRRNVCIVEAGKEKGKYRLDLWLANLLLLRKAGIP